MNGKGLRYLRYEIMWLSLQLKGSADDQERGEDQRSGLCGFFFHPIWSTPLVNKLNVIKYNNNPTTFYAQFFFAFRFSPRKNFPLTLSRTKD